MSPTPEAVAASMDSFGISYTELPRLAGETPAKEIQTRPGPHSKWCDKNDGHTHQPLSYVDARYVMDTLDRIVGPECWQRDHRMTESGKVSCGIGILVAGIGWVWKWDGAGETDIEGEKGSFSDSFKRAAVSWGIARDLYDKDAGRSTSAPVSRPVEQPAARNVVPFNPNSNERHDKPSSDDDFCPTHNLAWALKPGGISKSTKKPYDPFYACPFRPQRGEKFCSDKPSKAWLARHEIG